MMNNKKKTMIVIIILLFVLITTITNLRILQCIRNQRDQNISSTVENSTILFVNPETSTVDVGQTFFVDICVSNVTDLYGWEFKLRWNLTLLDVLSITEGDFLRSYGDTLFVININNTEGWLRAACTLIGSIPGVNGSGILATIEFHVESVGQTMLDLYDTKLVNSREEPIQHSTQDGYVSVSVHDVAIIALTASSTTVNVTIENQGTYTETFNITIYYTRIIDPVLGNETITLEPGTNTTLIFNWSPSAGRYEIRAEVNPVPGETDVTDNELTIYIYISSNSTGGGGDFLCRKLLK